MIIYKATNTVNGKIYIGLTRHTLHDRKTRHLFNAKNEKYAKYALYFAIKKYGEENFKWEVIDKAENLKELCEKEKYWIDYFDSYNNGYNMTIGGECPTHTPEVAKKISMALTGKKLSEERRKQMSLNRKGKGLALNHEQVNAVAKLLNSGKSHLEIAKELEIDRIIITRINNGNYSTKPSIPLSPSPKPKRTTKEEREKIVSLGKEGYSIRYIANELNVDRNTVKYHFKKNGIEIYFKKNGLHERTKDKMQINNPRSKLNIEQVKEVKLLLKEGNSISEIAEKYKVKYGLIAKIKYGQTFKWIEI